MADNILDSVYGPLNRSEVLKVRVSYDRAQLLRRAEELRVLTEYLGSELGLKDALGRLYCMTSTVFCGAGIVLPPDSNALRQVLRDVREDLDEVLAFFHGCEALIEPLERLQIEEHFGVGQPAQGACGHCQKQEPRS